MLLLLLCGHMLAFAGSAFRQLPEGQIESMWNVFAVHLRESWKHPAAAASTATAISTATGAGSATGAMGGRGSGGGGGDGDAALLAMDVDAELSVLFLRNLHVTSSIASCVGKLCTRLAEEVRRVKRFYPLHPGFLGTNLEYTR